MTNNPLKVIATSDEKPQPAQKKAQSSRAELQAKMERLWLLNPDQFNPMHNCIDNERIERTDALIQTIDPKSGSVVDLGAGYGELSRRMHKAGWHVLAVDIASNALKVLVEKGADGIQLKQDALPSTRLDDHAYDLVVCTDVIGYLDPRDYRLFMAELCRLINRDGRVVCSTAIDINSVDALQRFGELAETEFLIEEWRFSYNLLLIRLKNFFETPQCYFKASRDLNYRREELLKRQGLSRWWYKTNTNKWMSYPWLPFKWLAAPVVHVLKYNRTVMVVLEKICRFFWDEAGISHALFLGRRRPLVVPTAADLGSVERKGKRQVWE